MVIYIPFISYDLEVYWNRVTPSHHPFEIRISLINQPSWGTPMTSWKPPKVRSPSWNFGRPKVSMHHLLRVHVAHRIGHLEAANPEIGKTWGFHEEKWWLIWILPAKRGNFSKENAMFIEFLSKHGDGVRLFFWPSGEMTVMIMGSHETRGFNQWWRVTVKWACYRGTSKRILSYDAILYIFFWGFQWFTIII